MKALRIILAVIVVTCLFTLPTSAQNNRVIKETQTITDVSMQFPCMEESITGTIVLESSYKYFTDNNNRVGLILQHYKNTGTFIGDITGTEYTLIDRNTAHDIANMTFDKETVNVTSMSWLLQDGKKVARIKYYFHLTLVNGEPKATFDIFDVKCF
ncbi:hypothetical protein [uncultured Draconibacterium sp.]|uniref:hypothetical protein n=1 Tax=uncultured Draconibacterium sp. TaxID=1573823 RepID=UPI0025EF29B7|nr:hypothetical protein [uncultured Draconibacterium sp.]